MLLDCNYIENPYRSTTDDLSREKELGTVKKAILQIKFLGQLKKLRC